MLVMNSGYLLLREKRDIFSVYYETFSEEQLKKLYVMFTFITVDGCFQILPGCYKTKVISTFHTFERRSIQRFSPFAIKVNAGNGSSILVEIVEARFSRFLLKCSAMIKKIVSYISEVLSLVPKDFLNQGLAVWHFSHTFSGRWLYPSQFFISISLRTFKRETSYGSRVQPWYRSVFPFLVNFPPTQKYASRSLRKISNTFTTPLILFGSGNTLFILFYG